MNYTDKVENEIKKRMKTENMFIPNAGPRKESVVVKTEVEEKPIDLKMPEDVLEPKEYLEEPQEQIVQSEPKLKIPEKNLEEVVNKVVKSSPYARHDNPLYEAVEFFEADIINGQRESPVLEERKNCLLNLIAGVHGLSVLLEGKSRSGKSMIMDKCLELFPSYTILSSCSEKAIVDMMEEVNDSGILYIPEFQENVSANDYVKEAVKHLAEDKDWIYKRQGESFILSGKTKVFSTGADENKKIRRMDVEVLSRFIRLKTKDEEGKDKAICYYQDLINSGVLEEKDFSEERLNKLKNHVSSVVYDSSNFINPFSIEFGGTYLPVTQKSVHYRTLYYGLMNAFAKFDKPNRAVSDDKILINMGDVYLAHSMYHETYCSMLRHLSEHSFNALTAKTTESVYEKQKERFDNDIKELDEKSDKDINWSRLWNESLEIMKEKFPDKVDEWIDYQTKDGKITVYDPVEKSDVYLCEK